MAKAQPLGEFRQESDYSFSYSIFGRDNALLAGDAASFIDPVFSSGVYLALESGLLAAETVSQRLAAGQPGDARLYARYTREVKERVGTMRKLIDAYYHNASFEVFMTPKPPMGLDRAVNSVLAGCLNPPFSVRWRFMVFRLICRLHRHFSLVPKLNW